MRNTALQMRLERIYRGVAPPAPPLERETQRSSQDPSKGDASAGDLNSHPPSSKGAASAGKKPVKEEPSADRDSPRVPGVEDLTRAERPARPSGSGRKAAPTISQQERARGETEEEQELQRAPATGVAKRPAAEEGPRSACAGGIQEAFGGATLSRERKRRNGKAGQKEREEAEEERGEEDGRNRKCLRCECEGLEVGQKPLEMIFKDTGLDPDPTRRAKMLTKARMLLKSGKKKKKKAKSSGSSPGTRTWLGFDILDQRLKSIVALSKGAHWSLGRQYELIKVEDRGSAEDGEVLAAVRHAKEDEIRMKSSEDSFRDQAWGREERPPRLQKGRRVKKGKVPVRVKVQKAERTGAPEEKRKTREKDIRRNDEHKF
eukprot:s275_g9.t1